MRGALLLCVAACDFTPLSRLGQTSDDAGIDALVDADPVVDAPSDAAPLPIPSGHNLVFVTHGVYAGNLGGLVGADAICNNEARTAGLPGTYVAWLSTPGTPASSRLAGRGWVRRDGLGVVDTIADLKAGKMLRPVRLDAYGYDVGHATAFTATGMDGTYRDVYASNSCDGWTTASASLLPAAAGYTDGTAAGWTDHINPTGILTCGSREHLYCFGTSLSQPLEPPAETGWTAFLTRDVWRSGGGLATADALCATEASAQGLTGVFKAMLTTKAASAASRFAAVTQPWIRVDKVRLAATPSAFFARTLDAPLNVSADGTFNLIGNAAQIGAFDWTKPGSANPMGDYTCDDWQSRASAAFSELACSDTTVQLGCGFSQCDGQWQLFCLRAE